MSTQVASTPSSAPAPAAAANTTPVTPSTPAASATTPPADPAAAAGNPTESAAEKERAARHFAALAKRDKAIVDRERAIKEKEQKYSTYEERDKKFAEDPMALLQAYGYNLDEVVKRAANGGKLTPEQMAEKALKEIEKDRADRAAERDRLKKEEEDRQLQGAKDAEAKAVKQFNEGAVKFVTENKEKYPLTARYSEPAELIYHITDLHYRKTQRIMEYAEAAEQAEKALELEAESYFDVPKIQEKFGAKAKETPKTNPGTPPPQKTQPESITLSNDISSKGSAIVDEKSTAKTFAEQMAESKRKAAESLRWTNT